jgi:hypothetical protein
MATSEAKIRANRLNAQRSTGPRSLAGKRRSRYNALKHGWRGRMLIPVGEDGEMFLQMRRQLVRTFGAVTDAERILCTRIALAIWRGLRATRAETQAIDGVAEGFAITGHGDDDPAAAALSEFLRDGTSRSSLMQLVRYERHLTREARDGIRLLKEVQAARRAHVDGTACLEVGTILDGADPDADEAPPLARASGPAVALRPADAPPGAPVAPPVADDANVVDGLPALAAIRRVR